MFESLALTLALKVRSAIRDSFTAKHISSPFESPTAVNSSKMIDYPPGPRAPSWPSIVNWAMFISETQTAYITVLYKNLMSMYTMLPQVVYSILLINPHK